MSQLGSPSSSVLLWTRQLAHCVDEIAVLYPTIPVVPSQQIHSCLQQGQ